MKRQKSVQNCEIREITLDYTRTWVLLIRVSTNIFDSFVRKKDRRFATQMQRGVEASKAREAPPRNKRIMWTRFDVFEYLISHEAVSSLASYDGSDACYY